ANETDPDARRALLIVAAIRARLASDLEQAKTLLQGLHEEDASDLLAATALSMVLRELEEIAEAREVLSTTAFAIEDAPLGAALLAECGLLAWQQANRATAIDDFTRSVELGGGSTSTLLAWALRAANPDDADARRRALSA